MTEQTALPSLEECTTLLSTLLLDDEKDCNDTTTTTIESNNNNIQKWRKLIQQCLSHGTNYDKLLLLSTSHTQIANNEEIDNNLKCAQNAGELLSSALEWYLIRWYQQQQKKNGSQNDDDKMDTSADDTELRYETIETKLKDDPVICAIVESIWLVGCLLESSSEDNDTVPPPVVTNSNEEAKDDDNDDGEKPNNIEGRIKTIKQVSYDCLLIIIQHLVTPKPWMENVSSDNDEVMKQKEGSSSEDVKMEQETEDKPTKDNDAATKKNVQHPLIPITVFQTTLELSLLEAANLLPKVPPNMVAKQQRPLKGKSSTGSSPSKNKTASSTPVEPETSKTYIQKKLKKLNTDMYYRQHKFNLLSEESEGYSKLLTFLTCGIKDHGGCGEDTIRYVQELIGAFDLDPNRVLDVTLDTLEWELNDLVTRCCSATTTSTSSTVNNNNNGSSSVDQWGLDLIRTALSSSPITNKQNANDMKVIKVVHSLLSIIRELDGNYNDENGGEYEGRAVAHLLGFKYRSYRGMSIAAASAAAANKAAGDVGVGKEKKKVDTTTAVYPRSLHLSTAFLCAHGVLDPHALLPHLVPIASSAASTGTGRVAVDRKTESTATSLMQVYQTYCTETVKRLKKLGVVSLNSSAAKSSDTTKVDDKSNENEVNDTTMSESLQNDPIIGIFRALLAVVGDWDTCVAFLAHASVPNFSSLVKNSSSDDKDGGGVDKIRAAMDTAVLAACTLSESVSSDVCAWVNCAIGDMYKEMYPTSANGKDASKGKKDVDQQLLLLPSSNEGSTFVLAKDSTLAEMSFVLDASLSALVKSGRIRSAQNLYIKLCRLYKHKLTSASSSSGDSINDVDDDTFSVLSTFLVPSLSLFPSDTILPSELWTVLQHLPYTLRYKLYSAWRSPGLEKGTLRSLMPASIRTGQIPKPLTIIESEIETGIAARYVLKRISKENIKDTGRQLAKTSHNNPLVVFTDILGKIESYDNMILMMVDTFQFVTRLGLDVMGYCLLVSLGGGEEADQRNRTKTVGLNTEQWLASLETFTGHFYKKFPDVELKGILVYLTRRFKEGQSSELGVLRSLIKTVGGYGFVDYDSTSALSDLQLDGRCGSRLLKRETSSFGVIDDINRKASQHLRSVLQHGDLGVIILILLSQIRSRVLYSKSSETVKEHVKVIGNMYDDCEAVMCLLLEYLSDSSDDSRAKEKFAASMPSLSDLHENFGVDTSVAWMLCRPLVRKSMFYMDDSKLANKSSSGEPPAYLKPFTSSPEMTTSYQSMLPEAAWKHITPTMFEMFYSLAIYDVSCPEERYKVDIDRLKKDCERLVQLQKGGAAAAGQMSALAAQAAAAGGSIHQIRQATAFTQTHAAELARLKSNVDQLSKDFQRQQKRCKTVLSMLEAQKESLIASTGEGSPNSSMFAQSFMTFCIYPRCFLSPEDALFCAHFLKLLHKMKVPGFLTIELIDNIVNAVAGSFYCMTEDEAGNCSIFFNEIWKSVNSWRYDNDAFTTELKDTVRQLFFCVTSTLLCDVWLHPNSLHYIDCFIQPGSQLSKEFAEENNIEDHALTGGITHDDYKGIYSQWHQKIGSAAIGCLNSTEYMHTRAALIVLSRIVLVFPTQPRTGDRILKTLRPLQSDENERPDIRATAQGYSSQLMKARDEGMWKEENIAVTKARQEREKMKAEEKKKKLALQHEEMKKESEMISKQLGDGGRDGWRPDRRGGGGRPPFGVDPRMHSRVRLHDGI